MGLFYSFQFVLLAACATFYYKAADIENAPALLWMGISIAVYAATWLWLGWGMLGNMFAQILLLIAIAIFRVIREQMNR